MSEALYFSLLTSGHNNFPHIVFKRISPKPLCTKHDSGKKLDHIDCFRYLQLTYEEDEARQAYAYLISEADRLNDWVKKSGVDAVFELSPYTLNLVYFDLVNLQCVRH